MNTKRTNIRRGLGVCALGLATLVGLSGCNNVGEGAVSGAGIGALAGMGLGSLSGDMGKGAAAGAIVGGLLGGYVGDQNYRRSNGWGWSSGGRGYCD